MASSETDLGLGALRQVALGSSDLSRAVAFYRDTLGLDFVAEFPGIAFFRLADGTRLLLEHHDEAVPGTGVLYLKVEDIERVHEALAARGVAFDSSPHLIHRDDGGVFGAAGEEEWMAFFRDPDGNHLALSARVPGG